MNAGLLRKAIRELLWMTIFIGAFVVFAESLLTFVLAEQQERFAEQLAAMPFVQSLVRSLLGAGAAGALSPRMFVAIPFVHPVILALMWGHAIMATTRVPAGEIERGTVDVLLALPISRRELFQTETAACLGSGVVIMACVALGHLIGERLVAPNLRVPPGRTAIAIVNLFAVYVAVGAGAMLLSALSDRRGRAIAIAFALVIGSFLINYLAEVWAPAQRIAFLSILRYHRPLAALDSGAWPWRDIGVLCGVALVMWAAAGVVMSRRDITTT